MDEVPDEIVSLYVSGRYNEALDLIQSYEYSVRLELLKALILTHTGEFRKASDLFDKLLSSNLDPPILLKTITNKAYLLNKLGKYKEGYDLMRQIDPSDLDLSDGKDVLLADYFNLLGLLLKGLGKYSEARSELEKALRIKAAYDDDMGMAIVYNNLGIVLRNQGEFEDALGYYNQCLVIDRKIGNKGDIANTLNNIGVVYDSLGELQKALEYYRSSLELYKELESANDVASVENNIGVTLEALGNFREALDHFHNSLRHRENIEDFDYVRSNYLNLATVYYQLRDYKKSENYIIPLILRFEDQPSDPDLADALYLLQKIYMATGRDTYAITMRLRKLMETSNSPEVEVRAKMAEGMFLRKNKDLTSIVKSQLIFRNILKKEKLEFQFMISALFNLADLVLREYLILNEREVLEEFSSIIEKLDDLLLRSNNPRLEVEINFLHAHFALIMSEGKKYEQHLDKARQVIEENKMVSYQSRLAVFEDRMKEELKVMKDLDVSGTKLRSKMKRSQLEDYLNSIIELHG